MSTATIEDLAGNEPVIDPDEFDFETGNIGDEHVAPGEIERVESTAGDSEPSPAAGAQEPPRTNRTQESISQGPSTRQTAPRDETVQDDFEHEAAGSVGQDQDWPDDLLLELGLTAPQAQQQFGTVEAAERAADAAALFLTRRQQQPMYGQPWANVPQQPAQQSFAQQPFQQPSYQPTQGQPRQQQPPQQAPPAGQTAPEDDSFKLPDVDGGWDEETQMLAGSLTDYFNRKLQTIEQRYERELQQMAGIAGSLQRRQLESDVERYWSQVSEAVSSLSPEERSVFGDQPYHRTMPGTPAHDAYLALDEQLRTMHAGRQQQQLPALPIPAAVKRLSRLVTQPAANTQSRMSRRQAAFTRPTEGTTAKTPSTNGEQRARNFANEFLRKRGIVPTSPPVADDLNGDF